MSFGEQLKNVNLSELPEYFEHNDWMSFVIWKREINLNQNKLYCLLFERSVTKSVRLIRMLVDESVKKKRR